MNFFAKNVKYLRIRFNVSQTVLGGAIGRRQTTISNWEDGVSEPGVKELTEINHFFGTDIRDLIFSDMEKGNLTGTIPETLPVDNKQAGKSLPGKKVQYVIDTGETIARESGATHDAIWLVLQELRRNSEKLDELKELLRRTTNG